MRPRPHRTSPLASRAFTLLDITLALLVLGLVALLVLPAAGQRDTDQLNAAARLLLADIEMAQMRSLAHGSDPCVISFDIASNTYIVAYSSAPDTPIASLRHSTTVFGTGRAAALDRVTIDAIDNLVDDRMPFSPLGALATGADAAITLRCGGQTARVLVDASTGTPRVE